MRNGARERAKAADDDLARGKVWGPLHGVPITLEDAHATQGLRSTWGGFPGLANHVPAEDGTIAARLKAAGAIILGKTNGPVIWGTESIFGATNNPWNNNRTRRRIKCWSSGCISCWVHGFRYWP